MSNQKGLVTQYLIIGIILFVLMVVGLFIYPGLVKTTNQTKTADKVEPSLLPSNPPQTTTSAFVSSENKDELVLIDLPPGWNKEVKYDDFFKRYETEITSPDYKYTGGYGWPGLIITINKQRNDKTETRDKRYEAYYKDMHNPNPAGATIQNLQKVTIAGYESLSYEDTFEGNVEYYELWNGDDIWLVGSGSSNGIAHQKYRNELNSVLASIKLP